MLAQKFLLLVTVVSAAVVRALPQDATPPAEPELGEHLEAGDVITMSSTSSTSGPPPGVKVGAPCKKLKVRKEW